VTGALLALGSALCFGIADYAGGLLSRRANALAVALAVQVSGLLLLLLVGPLVTATSVGVADVGWGALSGVGTAVGVLFLYRGLTHGPMSVVVPLSAVAGLALAVLVGVLLMGERPSWLSWAGIAVAVPAVVLVLRTNGQGRAAGLTAVADGLVSSAGFALQYVALAQADAGAGLWPVAAGRVASVLTMALAACAGTSRVRLAPASVALAAAANGAVAVCGLTLYLLATRQEMVAVAVVLSSLYPAVPVLLGVVVLRERLGPQRVLGLLGALVAVVLLTVG
jgi:drug/metabolite transporter (DMT)-like permease